MTDDESTPESKDPAKPAGFVRWLLRPSHRHGRTEISLESAARRTNAIVYGNILVLAALAILTADDVATGAGILIMLGTAASTFVAHMLADQIGHSVLAGRDPENNRRKLLLGWWREARDSIPIASSAVLPCLFLMTAWLGWLPPTAAHVLSIGSVIVRFLLMGSMIGYLRGETRSRVRGFGAGIMLAGAAALVALLKVILTH